MSPGARPLRQIRILQRGQRGFRHKREKRAVSLTRAECLSPSGTEETPPRDRRKERRRSGSSSSSSHSGSRGKKKKKNRGHRNEAERITRKPFPHVRDSTQWRYSVGMAVAAASGRGDAALGWIREVEDDGATLQKPGSRHESLDQKIGRCIGAYGAS